MKTVPRLAGRRRRVDRRAGGSVGWLRLMATARSTASCRFLSATGSWSRSMAPVRTMSRRLASGRLAKARTRLVAGHLVVDDLQGGEAGLGAQAGAGDQDVEGPVGADSVVDAGRAGRRPRPRAGGAARKPRPGPGRPGSRPSPGRGSWDCARWLSSSLAASELPEGVGDARARRGGDGRRVLGDQREVQRLEGAQVDEPLGLGRGDGQQVHEAGAAGLALGGQQGWCRSRSAPRCSA